MRDPQILQADTRRDTFDNVRAGKAICILPFVLCQILILGLYIDIALLIFLSMIRRSATRVISGVNLINDFMQQSRERRGTHAGRPRV